MVHFVKCAWGSRVLWANGLAHRLQFYMTLFYVNPSFGEINIYPPWPSITFQEAMEIGNKSVFYRGHFVKSAWGSRVLWEGGRSWRLEFYITLIYVYRSFGEINIEPPGPFLLFQEAIKKGNNWVFHMAYFLKCVWGSRVLWGRGRSWRLEFYITLIYVYRSFGEINI